MDAGAHGEPELQFKNRLEYTHALHSIKRYEKASRGAAGEWIGLLSVLSNARASLASIGHFRHTEWTAEQTAAFLHAIGGHRLHAAYHLIALRVAAG